MAILVDTTTYPIICNHSHKLVSQFESAHPSCDKVKENLEQIEKLMGPVKGINERLRAFERQSCWNRDYWIYAITGANILCFLLFQVFGAVDFKQAKNEQITCIQNLQSLNATSAIIDQNCRKDSALEWVKFFSNIGSNVCGFAAIFFANQTGHAEKKRDAYLRLLQQDQERDNFKALITAILLFMEHKDNPSFKACIEKLRSTCNHNFFSTLVGSPELLTSFLLSQLTDTGMQDRLRRAVDLASPSKGHRKRHRRHGEGAASLDSAATYENIWSEIKQFVGLELRYLKIGNTYISPDGMKAKSEEDLMQSIEEKKIALNIASRPVLTSSSDNELYGSQTLERLESQPVNR